jgi:quercetin dioxygenase-like cupin family protein
MRYVHRATVLLALFAALTLGPAVAQHSESSRVAVETLIQTTSSWDGVPYQHYPAGAPELSVLKISIPAHTALNWHTHPMPNAAYVLSGELTVEKRGGPSKRFTAGQVVAEMVGSTHRGVTGSEPAVLIVFYPGTPGMPLSEEASDATGR